MCLICQNSTYFRWEKFSTKIGVLDGPYYVYFEIHMLNDSYVGIDNLRLVNCFPTAKILAEQDCTEKHYKCDDERCLDRNYLCDLIPDCSNGEDELWECGKSDTKENSNLFCRNFLSIIPNSTIWNFL